METGADAKTHKTRTRHISRKHGHEDKQDSPHGDEWSGHDTPSPCVKTQLSNGDDGVVSDSSDRKRSLSLSIDERATKYVKLEETLPEDPMVELAAARVQIQDLQAALRARTDETTSLEAAVSKYKVRNEGLSGTVQRMAVMFEYQHERTSTLAAMHVRYEAFIEDQRDEIKQLTRDSDDVVDHFDGEASALGLTIDDMAHEIDCLKSQLAAERMASFEHRAKELYDFDNGDDGDEEEGEWDGYGQEPEAEDEDSMFGYAGVQYEVPDGEVDVF